MHKIVFQNPEGKPNPGMEQAYTSIISASISELKCQTHDKSAEFALIFEAPNTYHVQVTACCEEFKALIDDKVAQMLS
jgi:hypothetical protein